MYCKNCGSKLIEGASFCARCGKPAPQGNKGSTRPATSDEHLSDSPRQVHFSEAEPTEDIIRTSEPGADSHSNEQHDERTHDVTVEYLEASRNRDKHEEAAAAYQGVARFYENSLIHCLIAGIILAPIMGSLFGHSVMASATVVTISGFLFPFGFAPLYRWVSEHGFFIVVNWLILIMLAIIVFFAAAGLGPIYICYAAWKIASNRNAAQRELNAANEAQASFATSL